MEMDFLGPRPVLQHARRGGGGDGPQQQQQPCPGPWRLAAPMMMMAPAPPRPNPDVMPAPAAHHHHHWKQQHPSFDQVMQAVGGGTRVPPPSPPQPGRAVAAPAFRCAIPPASYHAPSAALRLMGEVNPFRVPNCSSPPDPAAQLTVFYAGSVRVFDNISREKAEQIMFMAAKAAAQAAAGGGGSPVRRLPARRSEPADGSRSGSRQAASLARACSDPVLLTPHAALGFGDHASQQDLFLPRDVPLARSASLARFLERRNQRAANAAATPYSRRDNSPGSNSMDTFTAVSPANTASELSWFLGDTMGMNGDDEAPDTELKM